jgi:hypothetical protein
MASSKPSPIKSSLDLEDKRSALFMSAVSHVGTLYGTPFIPAGRKAKLGFLSAYKIVNCPENEYYIPFFVINMDLSFSEIFICEYANRQLKI